MAGSLDIFTDVLKNVSGAVLTGPMKVVDEVRLQRYATARNYGSKGMGEYVQGGEHIEDNMFFDLKPTHTHYGLTDTVSYSSPQVMTKWQIPWRFTYHHVGWAKQELGLNRGQMNRGARILKIKDTLMTKFIHLNADIANGSEGDFWAEPNNATMESSTGKVPYSLGCSVHASDLALKSTPTVAISAAPAQNQLYIARRQFGFTNIQTIDPRAQTKWANIATFYGEESGGATDEDNRRVTTQNLFRAMVAGYRAVEFGKMPKGGDHDELTIRPDSILTSFRGVNMYENGLMLNQDFYLGKRQDPSYPNPLFRGIPIDPYDLAETAKFWANHHTFGSATALVDENTGDGSTHFSGPRFIFCNGTYSNHAWHSENFMTELRIGPLENQPWVQALFVDSWHNGYNRSRRRHLVVGPTGGNITLY